MMATTTHRTSLEPNQTPSGPARLLPPFPFVAPATMTPLDSLIAILAVEEANFQPSPSSDRRRSSPSSSPSAPPSIGNNNYKNTYYNDDDADVDVDRIPSLPTTVSPLALRLDSSSRLQPPSSDLVDQDLPPAMVETDHPAHYAFTLTTPATRIHDPLRPDGHVSHPTHAPPPTGTHHRPPAPRDPFAHIGFTLEFTLQPRATHPPAPAPAPRHMALTRIQPTTPSAARHIPRHAHVQAPPAPNHNTAAHTHAHRLPTASFVSTDPLLLPAPRPMTRKATTRATVGRALTGAAAAMASGSASAPLGASVALGKILTARAGDTREQPPAAPGAWTRNRAAEGHGGRRRGGVGRAAPARAAAIV